MWSSVTSKYIVRNADWREGVRRGLGPVQDSQAVHNARTSSVWGWAWSYWHPQKDCAGCVYVYMLSDCISHTQQAAIALEKDALYQVQKNLPWFGQVWDECEEVVDFYDAGKHF